MTQNLRSQGLSTSGITQAVRIGSDTNVWELINKMLSNAQLSIDKTVGSGGFFSPMNFLNAASSLRDQKISDNGLEKLEPIIGMIMDQAKIHSKYGLRHLAYRINRFRFDSWVALLSSASKHEFKNYTPERIKQILQTLEYAATPPKEGKENYNQKISKLTLEEKQLLKESEMGNLKIYPNLKRLVDF